MLSSIKLTLAKAYADAPVYESRPIDHFMVGFPPTRDSLVTRENAMEAPFNRWSLQHIDRIIPSLTIKKKADTATCLTEALRDLSDLRFTGAEGRELSISEHLQATYTDAFLVMKDDRVIYETYPNQDPKNRHLMFSVTKSLTGTLAEMLVHQGFLDETALAVTYVPEFAGSAFETATVRNLMDMAVGLQYSEDYDDPDSEVRHIIYAYGLAYPPEGVKAAESIYEFLPTLKAKGTHGNHFDYVTAVTEALGWVMERATQKSCVELFELLWRELGCDRDGMMIADGWGRAMCGGGFSATLRDMARFASMMLNHGFYNNRQIVPSEVVRRIAQGGSPEVYARNEGFSLWSPGASYKSQWYVFNGDTNAIMAAGIHGQFVYIDFTANLVVIKQSSMPTAEHEIDIDTVRMLRFLSRNL